MQYNLAPLCLRRDISLLGFLYLCAHGRADPCFQKLFPMSAYRGPSNSRLQHLRHDLQMVEQHYISCHDLHKRSVFGLVRVFNVLPDTVVKQSSVQLFQRMLNRMAFVACSRGLDDWSRLFCPRRMIVDHVALATKYLHLCDIACGTRRSRSDAP